MNGEQMLKRWVEYSLCECALEVYPISRSKSTTFNSFCERLTESIQKGDLSKRDVKVLGYITRNANKPFSLSDSEIGEITANFFIEKRWLKYTKAIKLMEDVNWKLVY